MQIKPLTGHIIFWLSIMLLGTATIYPYYLNFRISIIDRAVFLPAWWIVTYLNWWFLMPRFLDKGKMTRYLAILLTIILVVTVIQRYLSLYVYYPMYLWEDGNPAEVNPFIPGKFIQFAAFLALPVICSIIIHLLMKWYKESYQAKQIIAQQQSAELSYLKAQINPHFLFNTLNNLYGLSLEQSSKVPNMILQLSDILSYSLYESSVEKIGLYKELKLIKDFIALEKERYEGRMQVEIGMDEAIDHTIEIAPLLLIPFVENAFKHGVKEATETIPVTICLSKENEYLVFRVKNKVSDETIVKNKAQGLGLKNLKRRLNLLYPDSHQLETKLNDEYFFATLKLLVYE